MKIAITASADATTTIANTKFIDVDIVFFTFAHYHTSACSTLCVRTLVASSRHHRGQRNGT